MTRRPTRPSTHTVEVDQSTKIEQSGSTIIAFSDGISFAVILPAKVKAEAIRYLRSQGKSKDNAHVLTFAAGVFLLLESYLDQLHKVTIDTEYTSWEGVISAFLLERIRRTRPNFEAWRLDYTQVGKSSPAHKKAAAVRSGKDKGCRVVSTREMLDVLESK